MKLLFILFICLPLITSAQTDSSFAPQIPKIPLNEAVKNILDFNCMVLELKDPLSPKEEVLVKSINRIYNESSFNELDSLFDHGNSLLQLYAFAGMCIKYKDSISDKHLFILSKKEMVKIYRQNAKKHPQKSIGEIASIFFNLEIKSGGISSEEQFMRNYVKDFILKYSAYPETYEEILFRDFNSYLFNERPIKAIIVHYRLKNLQGQTEEYHVRFLLENDNKIILIQEVVDEDSVTEYCFPPQLNWWFSAFGRQLTDGEKAELGVR